MDLTQIRYFAALARTLNFTRAAEQCHVTQPALTRAVQRLEDELGGPLIRRERALTQLTDLGHAMLPLLERTLAAAEAVRTEAASLRRQDALPLRLGLGGAVPADVLVPVLAELARRFPALALTLTKGTGERLTAMLLAGELDAALLPEAEVSADRLNRWPLFDDILAVLAAPGHKFAQLPAVPVAALDGEAVLADTEGGSTFQRALDGLQASQGIRPRVQHRGSSEDGIAGMVSAGLGVALATVRQPLASGAVAGGVVRRALAEPEMRYRVVLAAPAGRPGNRALDAFVKLSRARNWPLPHCETVADPARPT